MLFGNVQVVLAGSSIPVEEQMDDLSQMVLGTIPENAGPDDPTWPALTKQLLNLA